MESTKSTRESADARETSKKHLEELLTYVRQADLTHVVETEDDGLHLRIPVEDGEEVLVSIEDGVYWPYQVSWLSWSAGTQQTAPEPTVTDLADVAYPELAAAVIAAAITKRLAEMAAVEALYTEPAEEGK